MIKGFRGTRIQNLPKRMLTSAKLKNVFDFFRAGKMIKVNGVEKSNGLCIKMLMSAKWLQFYFVYKELSLCKYRLIKASESKFQSFVCNRS